MESSQHEQSGKALEQQLVKELQRMRDALANLSLEMQDLKFLVELPQQIAVQDLAADFIVRSQSK